MNPEVLQESQFFRERAARGDYERKHHKNGDADSDDSDETREVEAHKHVFGR